MFSHVWLFATPWTAADQASLSFTISWILLKFISIELMMPSSHLVLCHPFLLMPSIFPSISLFLWVSSLNQIAKDGTSTLALVLPADIQGWFPLGLPGLIALQSKTLSRIFSSTSLKALVLWRSAFFYGPTLTSVYDYWKSIALTIRTVVGKVMSLLFNTLSRFLRAFLPRSKNLLLHGLQSLSEVILDPKKVKSHCFHCSLIYLPLSDMDAMIFYFEFEF